MSQPASGIDSLLRKLESLDVEDRLSALAELRKYVGHRKATQAVFELRNDPDRRVRTLAREFLEESDRRTSESLSVAGQRENEKETWIDELIAQLKTTDPTDRVTALKELRMIDHPKAHAAVDKLKNDPHRTIRMLAEEAITTRKSKLERPKTSKFVGNVMVSTPVSEKPPPQDWREKAASSWGREMVPWLGFLYLALGLPFALAGFYMWLDLQGAFHPGFDAKGVPHPELKGFLEPGYAPDASMRDFFTTTLGLPADPLALALVFVTGAFQALGGSGLLLRMEFGRKMILLFHALLFLFGLLLPGVWMKIIPGALAIVIVYYLTRPNIAATFKGAEKLEDESDKANYGEMDRKVW